MRTLRFHIAVSLVFVLLPFTESGVIKNVFTSLIGGKGAGANEQNQKQPTGYAENEQRTPDHGDYRSPGSSPSGQYGAAGTYTKKPVVIDGTTEKYKNTSWYIENEDYLSPNKNETKQQRPSSQYGAAGTYTMRPVGITTERLPGNGIYPGENQQRPTGLTTNNNYNNQNQRPTVFTTSSNNNYNQRPMEFTNNNNHNIYNQKPTGLTNNNNFNNQNQRPTGLTNNNTFNSQNERQSEFTSNHNQNNYNQNLNSNNYNNQRPNQGNIDDSYVRSKETTRSSIGSEDAIEELKSEKNNAENVILQADGVTCCYSNLKEKIENRKLRCSETDCRLDKVYEKSSLWVCDTMKCTVASVDFTLDHGSKKLLECSDGRNIITVQDKPLNCGPNEKEHNGRCRKVFGATKPGFTCGF